MKTVYFVRHGSTPLLEAASFQKHETPLSEKGREQAEFVAERFESIDIDVILSSDMERAVQTATAIGRVKEMVVERLSIFGEALKPSSIRGRRRDDPDVAAIFKEITEQFSNPSRRHSDEENFFDVKKRAIEGLRLLESRPEKRMLVVTHGIILKVIIAAMMFGEELTAGELSQVDRFLYPSNTGITRCTLMEGRWRLVTWNDDAHLGEV